MTDSAYRLQVKIGTAEFSAEGPESTVKDAYAAFLDAIRTVAISPQLGTGGHGGLSLGENGRKEESPDGQPSESLLTRVFLSEEGIVSLRHLPPGEGQRRAADAAILILYGHSRLLRSGSVPITRLNEGLRKSGIPVTRIDKFIAVHSQLYMKGGTRSGGRFTLNNQGIRQAESWLQEWFSG